MEKQLPISPYLVGDSLTTADISLYGYTHVAHEGGFNLNEYPSAVTRIEKIQKNKKYIGMA